MPFTSEFAVCLAFTAISVSGLGVEAPDHIPAAESRETGVQD